MITFKEGDWVLITHPYMYDVRTIRKVHGLTTKKVKLLKFWRASQTEDDEPEVRDQKAVLGVFKSEAAARAARDEIEQLNAALSRELAEARKRYYDGCRALLELNPQ